MRRVGVTDRDWVEAALAERARTSMFALDNLARHGWDSDAPRGLTFFRGADDALLAVTTEGMAMPLVPGDLSDAGRVLSRRTLIGIVGETDQAHALRDALGLGAQPTKLADDEPQLALDLDDLTVPDGPGALQPFADTEETRRWRAAYAEELLGETPDGAAAQADRDVPTYAGSGNYRTLFVDGQAVAVTGLNARLPQIVQVGGVYTPPGLRGQGFARRAVGLHMAELRDSGVRHATLFASSDTAVRAYTACGFRPVGRYTLILFRDPVRLP